MSGRGVLPRWLVPLPYALAFALAALAYPQMPSTLPIHWGADGEPDAWGSKAVALFQLPMLLLPALILPLALERSAGENVGMLRLTALGVGLLCLHQTAALVFAWDEVRSSLVGVGALLAMVGNSLGTTQPSAFVGVRTPWVYRSRRAWYAAQRRGGSWLTGYGLLMGVSGGLLPRELLIPWLYPGAFLGLLPLTLWLFYASYLDYKRDPDPQPVEL